MGGEGCVRRGGRERLEFYKATETKMGGVEELKGTRGVERIIRAKERYKKEAKSEKEGVEGKRKEKHGRMGSEGERRHKIAESLSARPIFVFSNFQR